MDRSFRTISIDENTGKVIKFFCLSSRGYAEQPRTTPRSTIGEEAMVIIAGVRYAIATGKHKNR